MFSSYFKTRFDNEFVQDKKLIYLNTSPILGAQSTIYCSHTFSKTNRIEKHSTFPTVFLHTYFEISLYFDLLRDKKLMELTRRDYYSASLFPTLI